MFDRKSVGKSLQKTRKAAGFKSAKAFAEHMGYNAGTYTDWEQGQHLFSFEQAWEMADALGCTLDELGGRTPPRQNAHGAGLTSDEGALLVAYRQVDARARDNIKRTAEYEAARSGEADAAGDTGRRVA